MLNKNHKLPFILLTFVLFNQASTKSLWICKMCLIKENKRFGSRIISQSFMSTNTVNKTKLSKDLV